MRIILLVILGIQSAQAIEFNNKAFQESLKQYQHKAKEWVANPKGIVKEFKQKYEPSFNNVKDGVKNIDTSKFIKSQEELLVYYNFLEGKFKRYAKMSSGDEFYRVFSSDVSMTFNWAYNNVDAVPLIGPYKREILTKVNMMKAQSIPYESIIRAGLAQ